MSDSGLNQSVAGFKHITTHLLFWDKFKPLQYSKWECIRKQHNLYYPHSTTTFCIMSQIRAQVFSLLQSRQLSDNTNISISQILRKSKDGLIFHKLKRVCFLVLFKRKQQMLLGWSFVMMVAEMTGRFMTIFIPKMVIKWVMLGTGWELGGKGRVCECVWGGVVV